MYEEAASDDRRMKVMEKEIHTIEMAWEKEIEVDYCRTKEKVTGIFIKVLKTETLVKFKKMLGMFRLEEFGLREAM